MQEQISQAVQIALQGTRQINITFKEETAATGYIIFLLEMKRNGNILLTDSDEIMLRYISHHNRWEPGRSYTILITLTKKFNEKMFIEQMHHALKEIEAVN